MEIVESSESHDSPPLGMSLQIETLEFLIVPDGVGRSGGYF